MEMITSSKLSLYPQKLPPTERVAHAEGVAHMPSLRVHLRVVHWRDLDFDPEAWGWKLDGTVLEPVMTIRLQHQKTSCTV